MNEIAPAQSLLFSSSTRKAMLWLGGHLVLGAVFILVFSGYNQWGGWKYKLMFVAFHCVSNSILWLLVLLVSGYLQRSKMRWLRRLAQFLPGIVFVLVLLLWVLDWVTTVQWGNNLSDQLIWEIIRHLPAYLNLLPIKVYLLTGIAIGLVFAAYQRLAGRAIREFPQVLQQSQIALRQKQGLGWLLIGVISYAALFGLLWHPWMVRWNYWQREPLVSLFLLSRGHLFFPEQARAFFPATPRRLQNAARDQQLRQTYPKADFQKRNVILITVDSWRADHLPFYGYERQTSPFLTRLFEQGQLRKVAEARAACNTTYCAVMSILASRRMPDLGNGLFQLQDVLKDQGYQIHFLLSGIHTAWYDLRNLYGKSIDTYVDGTLFRNYVANDDRGILEKLDEMPNATAQPAFFYFHLMAPHLIGVRLPEYAEWQPVSPKLRVLNNREVNRNTYDNGVRMADAMIEKIFAALDAKGYLHESIVVILGDHGEALGEHQQYSHGLGLYEEDLRIPFLIVDAPDVTYRNLISATQLDVAPTILDCLGLTVPASWQGQSLFRAAPAVESFHQAGLRPQEAILWQEGVHVWKYIINRASRAEELYELRSDPGETRNLVQLPEAAAILPRLRARLEAQ
ncbi:MAG: sulfatase [Acidobacteria bacterium]|nr:sulfatase [Acidobacteriota bacterium]